MTPSWIGLPLSGSHAPHSDMNRCPVESCTRPVRPGHLTCRECWQTLTPRLRAAVYRSWNRGRGIGTVAYRDARAAALAHARDRLGGPRLP